MTARYAIYFAPDDSSELGVFGATVLRRQAVDPSDWLNPHLPVSFPHTADWPDQIKKPAHYGFHATIKAPFALAAGTTPEELLQELADLCKMQSAISLKGLAPIRTCRYDALAFEQQPPALPTLAAECVTRFEKYRAPLCDADIQRRNPDALSESELASLHRYGYPYVLDDFNFHMTLSGQNNHQDNTYIEWLQELYQAMVTQPPTLDRLCVFHQPDRQSPFIRIKKFQFS